jgi:hypothetical protein
MGASDCAAKRLLEKSRHPRRITPVRGVGGSKTDGMRDSFLLKETSDN